MEWIALTQHRYRWQVGASNYSNEPSGSTKCREFLDR